VTGPTPTPATLAEHALQDFREGRFAAAAEGFEAARASFEQAGDRRRAAETANNLCVALLQARQPAKALRAVQGTTEVFDALGDHVRAAQAAGNLASALEATGDLAAAERAYQQALQRFADLGDRDGQATILRSLSQLQLKRGRPMEALASMQAGLEQKPRRNVRDRWLRRLLDLPLRLLGR
jgi:tetratricopeptide (TPR) repeat protein